MNHPYIADRYRESIATPMGQTNQYLEQYPDLINFSLGDPDLTTDERIIQQAFADALNGHTHYTDSFGIRELRRAIKDDYRRRFEYDLALDEILITTSGCHAMWLVLEAILNTGDEVIIPSPFFTPYPQQVKLAGGVPVYLELSEDENYQINPDKLRQLITPKTKALIINTPSNPTGACLTRQTMEQLGLIAQEFDLVVIADDIYTALSFKEPFLPFTSLPGMKARAITIGSFSKDYAMTGWRIGYILADSALIRLMKDINENCVFSAPSISQRAALHAISLRDEIVPPMVEEFKRRVDLAYQRICQIPNMSVREPEGTFYLFVNIKPTGLTSQQVVDRILHEAHVLTIPGDAFGPGGEGYIRLAVTVGEDVINEAFDRIAIMDLFSEKK